MASDEHRKLAQYLKDVHSSLRQASLEVGTSTAWTEHCRRQEVLDKYAQCMEKLATQHWDVNYSRDASDTISRIKWSADQCRDYFVNQTCKTYREKELVIADKVNITLPAEEPFKEPVTLIDVGSCYNPFKMYSFLDVLAIDLCPANEFVHRCDFLSVPIGSKTELLDNKVNELAACSFDVVTFCFVLEYIPSSELRIKACENAYSVLKPGGLLIISTPDSKHVGANCQIMKCWRYALAMMGFARIKYEKLKHMHCMVFRKALSKDTAVRWATLHKQQYMEYRLHIPQDNPRKNTETSSKESAEGSSEINVNSNESRNMEDVTEDDKRNKLKTITKDLSEILLKKPKLG